MPKFSYTVEFETNNNSVLYVMNLMMPIITDTLKELEAKEPKQELKLIEE